MQNMHVQNVVTVFQDMTEQEEKWWEHPPFLFTLTENALWIKYPPWYNATPRPHPTPLHPFFYNSKVENKNSVKYWP